jgi:hypothetical protein
MDDKLTKLVYQSIREMEDWMIEHVRGFDGFTEDLRRRFAQELAQDLIYGSCTCGLEVCKHRHRITNWEASGIKNLRLFVEQAVIGPTGGYRKKSGGADATVPVVESVDEKQSPASSGASGKPKGFDSNSITQSMLFRRILRLEYQMLVALTELKRCQACTKTYEEWRCIQEGCDGQYCINRTKLIAQYRLLIEGIYFPVQRWLCGTRKTDKDPHYYALHRPGGAQSNCPLAGCVRENSPHGERTSTLWVRRDLAGIDAADPAHQDPSQTTALAIGLQKGLRNLSARLWDAFRKAIDQDTELPIAKHRIDLVRLPDEYRKPGDCLGNDDCLVVLEWLFDQKTIPISRNVPSKGFRAALQDASKKQKAILLARNDRKAIQDTVRQTIRQELDERDSAPNRLKGGNDDDE